MKKDLYLIIIVIILIIVFIFSKAIQESNKKSVIDFGGYDKKISKIENHDFSVTDISTGDQNTPEYISTYKPTVDQYYTINIPQTTPNNTPNTYTPQIYTPITNPSFTCPNYTSNKADIRDMWVWKDNIAIITTNTQTQKDFFDFVDSHRIRTIYLNLPTSFFNDSTNVAYLKTFLNTSKNQHCLSVEALSGAPNWVALPNNNYFSSGKITNEAIDWANAIKNFNASILYGDSKLTGLQYDVEPYSINSSSGYTPYWGQDNNGYTTSTSQQIIGNALIDMLQAVKNNLAGTQIQVDIAIPRWYDTKLALTPFVRTGGTTGKSLAEYIIDTADVVTIMDYVNNASSIYSDAQNELNYGSKVNKKIRLGVDTDSNEIPTTTFYGSSCLQMNNTLSSAYNMLTSFELISFDVFSIEYYKDNNNTPASYSLLCP